MGNRIYGYEKLEEHRCPDGNLVIKARAAWSLETVVWIYQWTPVNSTWNWALTQASALYSDYEITHTGVTLFSIPGSICLAAPTSDSALQALLETLRPNDLFTGSWPGIVEPKPPPNPTPKSAVVWTAIALFAIAILALLFWPRKPPPPASAVIESFNVEATNKTVVVSWNVLSANRVELWANGVLLPTRHLVLEDHISHLSLSNTTYQLRALGPDGQWVLSLPRTVKALSERP